MTAPAPPARYAAADLAAFGRGLLEAAGMPPDRAADVADVLVEADLLGHDTHGLNLLPIYLREIEAGSMTLTGDPLTLADRGAAVTWDGRRLPGPWLVLRAYELAAQRARLHGTGTVVIRRSHHVACLAAYLERAAAQGLVLLVYSSGPSTRTVAPFGGVTPVYTPNPLAAGFPAGDTPVMLDVSTSITTNNLMARLNREGRRLEHPWLIDAQGRPSTDPSVVFADPPGSILPIGGLDHGHKGYALSLMVEALTGGLSGHGRADTAEGWGANVFVQVLDPEAFGGRDDFERQTRFVADACRASRPRPGVDAVRLPGEAGLRRKADQLARGVLISDAILDALRPWSSRHGVAMPARSTAM